jgi:hypothetical protein
LRDFSPSQFSQQRPAPAEILATGPELRMRMVSVAKIRLDPSKSTRLFKRIICDDISEFESYMPSHAVGLSQVRGEHFPAPTAPAAWVAKEDDELGKEQKLHPIHVCKTETRTATGSVVG